MSRKLAENVVCQLINATASQANVNSTLFSCSTAAAKSSRANTEPETHTTSHMSKRTKWALFVRQQSLQLVTHTVRLGKTPWELSFISVVKRPLCQVYRAVSTEYDRNGM